MKSYDDQFSGMKTSRASAKPQKNKNFDQVRAARMQAPRKEKYGTASLLNQLHSEQQENAELEQFLDEQAELDHESVLQLDAIAEEDERQREEEERNRFMDSCFEYDFDYQDSYDRVY